MDLESWASAFAAPALFMMPGVADKYSYLLMPSNSTSGQETAKEYTWQEAQSNGSRPTVFKPAPPQFADRPLNSSMQSDVRARLRRRRMQSDGAPDEPGAPSSCTEECACFLCDNYLAFMAVTMLMAYFL